MDRTICESEGIRFVDGWENISPLSAPNREFDAVIVEGKGEFPSTTMCPHGCGQLLRFEKRRDGRVVALHPDCPKRPRRRRGL